MINADFYKKAYLLEVFNKTDKKIEDAFCFSVPPESEEFTYTHRISQTKTFGGICVDHYGNEAVKISLSGSTINQEIKYIYRSSLAAKKMTGEQEIYYLRDLLEKVGQNEKLEMRLYDLSKAVKLSVSTTENDYKYISNWWVVYLDSFRIKRSKDKPLAYNYQIEFTGEPKTGQNFYVLENIKVKDITNGTTEIVQKAVNSPSSILTKIDNGINKMRLGLTAMQSALDKANNMVNQIYIVQEKVEQFADVFNDYADMLQNFHTFYENSVKQVVKVGTNIIKSCTGIGLDVARGFFAGSQLLTDSVIVLKDLWNEGAKLHWSDCYTEEKLNAMETTIEELENSVASAFYEVIEGSNEIAANIVLINFGEIIINTDQNGNDYPVTCYGARQYVIKDGDTLEKISYNEYGTTDYIPMLEMYNNITDDTLETGKIIKLPTLDPTARNFRNQVYEDNESLGTDLALTEDGDIENFGGDVDKISGDLNLQQSLEMRLSSYMGSNVRNVLHGLRNSTGDNQASNSYLLSSLEQTLSEEPRIAEINSIAYEGAGDSLIIDIDYTNIKNEKKSYQGVI